MAPVRVSDVLDVFIKCNALDVLVETEKDEKGVRLGRGRVFPDGSTPGTRAGSVVDLATESIAFYAR